MNEDKVKHLELIQGAIERLAQNSFALKGWAVTLVAALFALSAKESIHIYFLIALIPALTFWGLDAFYLMQEEKFRKLYDAVRILPVSELENNPFSMDTSPYEHVRFPKNMPAGPRRARSWFGICWSTSIGWLYGSMVFAILLVTTLTFTWLKP